MNILAIAFVALLMQDASLGGRVTQTGTSEGLRRVTLELRAADANDSVQYTVITKDDGAFSFQNVKPGKYRLAANRQGYVRMEYGQRKTNGRGMAIDIGPNQTLRDAQMSMMPAGAIAGRVYDINGKPVVKANVQARKPAYQNGRRTLVTVRSTLTNDLGEYRLFDLNPGPYYVSGIMPDWNSLGESQIVNPTATGAGNAVTGARFGNLSPDTDPLAPARLQPPQMAERYQTIYFPGTTDDQGAGVIEVKAGESTRGIDVLLSPVRTRRIRGVVVDGETGQPPKLQTTQPVQVVVNPSMTGGGGSPFADRATGAFDTQALQAPSLLTAILGLKMGRISIPFGDTDIDNTQIILASGNDLPGQIRIEGAPAGETDPGFSSFRVTLRSEPQTLFTPAAPQTSGVISNTGTFTLKNVFAGNYRVNVTPILNFNLGQGAPSVPSALQKLYVKSIHYGDADVLNDLLHIEGRPNQALTIVVGTNAASFGGTVIDANQQPAGDVTVALVPANRNRIDLFRTATTDASAGKFQIGRIPPGDYKVFAWDDVLNGAWFDPQFLKAYEERGIAVHLSDGAKEDIRLPVILN